MLATALLTVLVFAVLMGLMALGVMVSGRRLRGSCGGDPGSAHCGCSPEKKAACRDQARAAQGGRDDVFAGPALTEETLAPPGEQRLMQLRSGRR